MGKEDNSSPAASIESFITSVIKVWTVDIPNIFIQADYDKDPQGNRIIMVIVTNLLTLSVNSIPMFIKTV